MEVLVELREIRLSDDPHNVQIIVLGEVDGPRQMEIGIGQYEAVQLDMALHGEKYPRPLTHDLALNIIEGVDASLDHVLVDDLRATEFGIGGTFFGKLVLRLDDDRTVLVDSRPSDAIVLATKVGAPIYVEDHVLDQFTQ